MTLTEIPLHDDAAFRAFHTAWVEAERAFAPAGIVTPYEHRAAQLRNEPAYKRTACWLGDRGFAEAWWYETVDNRHRLDCYLGGDDATLDAAYDTVAAMGRDLGRTTLGMEALTGGAVSAWAERTGWKLALTEEQNVCRMTDTDPAALRGWRDEGDPAYELVAFDGPCPDDLLDDYLDLLRTMNDAPRGELDMEDVVFTPDRVRENDRARIASGVDRWTVLARERATGRLVAFTELVLSPRHPLVVEQDDTAVLPAHRGHRLGLRVKAANLLRVLEERPDAVCVVTWNAESNKPMIDVNRALGFRRQCVWQEWQTTI